MGKKVIVVIDVEAARTQIGYQDGQDTLIFAISHFLHQIYEGAGGSETPIPIREFATIQGPVEKFKLGYDLSDAQRAALAKGQAVRDANREARVVALAGVVRTVALETPITDGPESAPPSRAGFGDVNETEVR